MYKESETMVYDLIVRGIGVTEVRVGPEVHEKMQDEWRQMTGNYGETLNELAGKPLVVVHVPGMKFEVR